LENLSLGQLIPAIVGLAVLLGIFAGVVGGFVRMESKSNQNTSDIADIYRTMEKHTENRNIHHDGEELDRRFNVVESGMHKIEKGIDKLVERFDKFLNK
jgi:hypothetical protein